MKLTLGIGIGLTLAWTAAALYKPALAWALSRGDTCTCCTEG